MKIYILLVNIEADGFDITVKDVRQQLQHELIDEVNNYTIKSATGIIKQQVDIISINETLIN